MLLNAEDVVMCARNPYRSVLLEVAVTLREPFKVEGIHILRGGGLVPLSFVHTHHLAALARYASAGQEVWRVGKDHVEFEVEIP